MLSWLLYSLLLSFCVQSGRSSLSCYNISYWEVACESYSGAGSTRTEVYFNSYRLIVNCTHAAYSCAIISTALSHFEIDSLNGLTVVGCKLEEPLACTLNGSAFVELALDNTHGDLLPAHLQRLTSVHSLKISQSDDNLKSVPYDSLSVLPSLAFLEIRGGHIRLKGESIEELSQLTTFRIWDGQLKEVAARSFINTPKVTALSLWGNLIDNIHEDAFEGLSNLSILNLNNNSISNLPQRLFLHCPLLTTLYIQLNKLRVLQSHLFDSLTKLAEVQISKNCDQLVLENETFADLPLLKSLYITTSRVESLPNDLFKGTPLEILDLKENRLVEIPPGIFKDTKLKFLDLSNNRIVKLPSSTFINQTDLNILSLNGNCIRIIQRGLFNELKNLTELNLRRNKLEILESTSFDGLLALTNLDLSENCLTTLNYYPLDTLRALEVPSASHTTLQPPDLNSPFNNLLRLGKLQLQHNQISRVYADWRQLPNLEQLNLSYNAITHLSADDLMWDERGYQIIDFSYNKITYIEPYIPTSQRQIFYLNNNPYSCDCTLYPLIKTLQEIEDYDRIGPIRVKDFVCSMPLDLAGRLFTNITEGVLKCPTCSTNCSCDIRMNMSTAVYELTCSSLPRSFPATNLPIQITLTNKTKKITKLPSNVKYLIMSNLSMTELPHINASLEVDLRHNRLTEAPLQLFEANCSLKLSSNPFDCECDSPQTFKALKRYENLILDFPNVSCSGGLAITGHNVDDLCVTRQAIIQALTSSGGLLTLGACVLVLYINKNIINIYLKKCGFWRTRQCTHGKKYDAFLSYEDEDEEYVYRHVIPNLERGRYSLKLCVPCRDWEVGALIPEQISQSVKESYRTIIVLSRNYGRSTWRQMEFRTAQALQGIVVLIMNDVSKRCSEQELKTYTNMNTCVRASDPLVWDKVKSAVLKRNKFMRAAYTTVNDDVTFS